MESTHTPQSDWVITIPKAIPWEEYLKEVEDAKLKGLSMYYRVRHKPRCQSGDRVFVVWNGRVRGWMRVISTVYSKGFICHTTGREWQEGWYIERRGDLHLVEGPAMMGFRGIRSYSSAD